MSASAAIALSGCVIQTNAEPPDSAETPSTTSPAPVIVDSTDILFTISGKVRSASGSTIKLEMVGHAPQPFDSAAISSLKNEFLALCQAQGGMSVSQFDVPVSEQSLADYGSSLMLLDVVSSPKGQDLATPIDLVLGSPFYAQVASGPVVNDHPNENCYGAYSIHTSGTVRAIGDYETGSPKADLHQWRYGSYGFSVPSGSAERIDECTIVLTPLAHKSMINEAGWDASATSDGTSCVVGYIGE